MKYPNHTLSLEKKWKYKKISSGEKNNFYLKDAFELYKKREVIKVCPQQIQATQVW